MDDIKAKLKNLSLPKRDPKAPTIATPRLSQLLKESYKNNQDAKILNQLSQGRFKIRQGQKSKKGALDLVLAFDTTSSMSDYRKVCREKFDYIAGNLNDMLDSLNVSFAGVGEYTDKPYTLQMTPFTTDKDEMKKNIYSIRDTGGGGACQVSLELLFQELNKQQYRENAKHSLVVVSDQIPHGMDNKCRNPRANYRTELAQLKKNMNFYFVSAVKCPKEQNHRIRDNQKMLVDHPKYFLHLQDIETLPNLIVAMCMSDVGRLNYMMQHVE